MKNYLLLALLFVLFNNQSWSQCTPVDCPGAPSLFPFGGVCDTVLPTGIINVFYSESESFRATNDCINPSSFDPTLPDLNLKIRTLRDFTFSNLPLGMNATTNQGSYSTSGGLAVGCAAMTGTPTQAGLFQMQIGLTADATIFILDLFGPCTGIEVDSSAGFDFSLDLIILPDPSFAGLDASYCENDAPVALTSTGSHSGTFSGPGVTGSQFDPATAGPGTHMIIHTVSAQDGVAAGPAINADTQTVVVEPLSICDPCAATQDIPIGAGWNIISGFIQPDAPNMLTVLEDISSDIIILKNGVGDAVFPSLSLNDVGDWNVEEGYKVKASATTILSLGCTQVDPAATTINLPSGWSIISYLRTDTLNAAAALASLGTDLILAKDNSGNTFFPSIPLNGIGNLTPGQGYQVKLSAPGTLTYPANTARLFNGVYTEVLHAEHYIIDKNTGSNATIVVPLGSIPGFQKGDELGVFTSDGQLAGSGVFNNDHFAVTIWGNDVTAIDQTSFLEGEFYQVRIWKHLLGEEFDLETEFSSGMEYYTMDGISVLGKGVIQGSGAEQAPNFFDGPTDLFIYPNPAKEVLNTQIYLSKATVANVSICDVTGKIAMPSITTTIDNGQSTMEIDLSSLSPGQYFYRMETSERTFIRGFVKLD